MTNGDFVSGIINELDLLSKDTWISRRAVLQVGKSKAKTLLAQRVDEFKLRNAFDLISVVPCFEMEEVDRITCAGLDITNCNTVMKSVKKLPETIYGRTGIAIFSINSIDDSTEYKQSTAEAISNRKKLKYKKPGNNHFYFIDDGYLYITEYVEAVKIRMIAINEEEVEDCGCDSEDTDKKSECKSLWDMKFPATDILIENIRAMTLQELLSTVVSIPKDENPNMDENQKSATVR